MIPELKLVKIDNYQSLVTQSNSIRRSFERSKLCLIGKFNKGGILVMLLVFLFLLPFHSKAQCNYSPGDVILQSSQVTNPTFYTTAYLLSSPIRDSILQVNTTPTFPNLKKGVYEAYAVTYKTRDSIFNLRSGRLLEEITSTCLDFSNPFVFSVCAQPQLQQLEERTLEVCADINTQLKLTDSLTFEDADELLDTFSIFIQIIESPDRINDVLEVDLSPFTGLTQSYNNSILEINGVRSPLQVQAILRSVYFYSSSKIKGKRKIEFQVGDGINLSNAPNREINVSTLPAQPIQIFRKKKE